MTQQPKNILIAYLPSRKDLGIAQNKHWYRIPLSFKQVPNIVKKNTVKLIAFYHPKIFQEDAHLIRYYGIVNSISIVKRKNLLKGEPKNPKSENLYYKIQFEKLLRLPQTIISNRKRRILFITTTLDRFDSAKEINDLFFESPLEEKFWDEFKRIGLSAERQFYETIGKDNYFIDFALFCKERKLAVECDGDTFHNIRKDQVIYDKRRDNVLESRGWHVLRYSTEDIESKFDTSIKQVCETVNRFGGIMDPFDQNKSRFFPDENNEPTLFQYPSNHNIK